MDYSSIENFNLTTEERTVLERISKGEQMMGNNLIIPFDPNNSGSRKLMAFNQTSHVVNTSYPDIPFISTGYETLFGEKSSSHTIAECDYDVLAILHKFDNNPKIHYYLLVKESDGDRYDIIERVEAVHTCEAYGYRMNNKYLDSRTLGARQIKKGDIVRKSNVFDEYGNRGGGVNLLCAYIQCTEDEEDAIIISEAARDKLKYEQVHEINIVINENDIPLNIYGDDNNYKIMPDAGEDIVDGLLLCNRRIITNEILFSQSNDRLKHPQVPDDKYYASGKVVDISVVCNNPELLHHKHYQQLNKYYQYSITFSKSVVDAVDNLVKANPNYRMSYELDKLYNNSKRIIEGRAIISNDKKFSNMIVTILILETKRAGSVDKLSDRYGGKGEIGEVRPTHLMPRLEDGTPIDIILNPPSIIKRQNLGTIIEPTINMASRVLLRHIYNMKINSFSNEYKNDIFTEQWVNDSLELIADFLFLVSNSSYQEFTEVIGEIEGWNVGEKNIYEKLILLNSILESECMFISVDPFDSANIDLIKSIKDFLPEIEDQYVYYDTQDSNGNLRTIKSRRPITVGHKYMYIMKQIGSIDHSAVSASATGIKNDNVKSGNKKVYKSPIKETPIRFGEMEVMNLIHFSKEVYKMINLYSSSPQARRSLKDILSTDNIFDINLQLDETHRNRNVEILNAYLSAMGLQLEIKKVPRVKRQIMINNNDIWSLYGDNLKSPFPFMKIKSYQEWSDELDYRIEETPTGQEYLVENNKVTNYKLFKIDPSLSEKNRKLKEEGDEEDNDK